MNSAQAAPGCCCIQVTMEELLVKLKTWKTEMGRKGLRVNMGKTKVLVSGPNPDLVKKSVRNPCGVCQTGGGCLSWIHKKCNGIKGPWRPDSDFRCARCLGNVGPIDGRLVKEVQVDVEKVEAHQSSVIWEICFLLAVFVNWLQSHVANRLWASFANYSPSSPTAICHV